MDGSSHTADDSAPQPRYRPRGDVPVSLVTSEQAPDTGPTISLGPRDVLVGVDADRRGGGAPGPEGSGNGPKGAPRPRGLAAARGRRVRAGLARRLAGGARAPLPRAPAVAHPRRGAGRVRRPALVPGRP